MLHLVLAAAATTVGSLSVAEDDGRVVVTSAAPPTWKATFDRAHGGILWDLRIPASSDLNLVVQRGEPIGMGSLSLFVRTGSGGKAALTNDAENVILRVLERSSARVRLSASGTILGARYTQTYTFTPSQARVAGEITFGAAGGNVGTGVWMKLFQGIGGTMERMDAWDRDPEPVRMPANGERGGPLPDGLDYPFTVRFPVRSHPGVSMTFSMVKVPVIFSRARFYNFWSTADGQRFDGFNFGGRGAYENGKPYSYEYTWEIAGVLRGPVLYPPDVEVTSPAAELVSGMTGAITPGGTIRYAALARDREDGDLGDKVRWTLKWLDGSERGRWRLLPQGASGSIQAPPDTSSFVLTASVTDKHGATVKRWISSYGSKPSLQPAEQR